MAYLFHSLKNVLCSFKIESNLPIFSLMDHAFGIDLKIHHHTHGPLGFLLLPFISFIVLCFTFRSVIHFELTFL